MKKILFAAAAMLLPVWLFAQAPDTMNTPFYTASQAPHLEKIIPDPPKMSDPRFLDDYNQYLWGKSIRDTERGKVAVEDATLSIKHIFDRFSPAVGRTLTVEDYPVLAELINRSHYTEMQAGISAKKYFKRVRPYQQFKEASGVPKFESPTDFTSYPSGHTHAVWLAGMILTAVDPAHTEDIMKVAYEMGQSRVIVGFHYQSDVDMGRVVGSVTFARLCAMPEFLDLLQKAKDEYNSKNN